MNIHKYNYFAQNIDELKREREYFQSFVNTNIINMINLATLKNLDIKILNNQISEINFEVDETIKSALSVQIDLTIYLSKIKNQLSFFDKFLFGLFGNTDRISFYESIQALFEKQEFEIRKLYANTKDNIKSRVHLKEKEIVKEYLSKTDEKYQLYNSELISIQEIIEEMKILLTLSEKTLSSISESEVLEVFDIFSKSTAVGLLSTISTNDTNNDINKFKEEIKNFYELRHEDLVTLNTIDFIDDILHLNIGIDLFAGLMQIDNLNKSEKQIKEIKVELNKEINSLEKAKSIINKKISKRVSEESHFKTKN